MDVRIILVKNPTERGKRDFFQGRYERRGWQDSWARQQLSPVVYGKLATGGCVYA